MSNKLITFEIRESPNMDTTDAEADPYETVENPPLKRMRFEPPAISPADGEAPVDDLDDLYDAPSPTEPPEALQTSRPTKKQDHDDGPAGVSQVATAAPGGIPGLGLLQDSPADFVTASIADGTPALATTEGDGRLSLDARDNVGGQAIAGTEQRHSPSTEPPPRHPEHHGTHLSSPLTTGNVHLDPIVPTTAAADLFKGVPNLLGSPEEAGAEWEADSSGLSSSDSDDTSSDSESSEDDDGYELLDPEEQARILMQGDGGSDDGTGAKGGKAAGDFLLKTKNEVIEEKVEKPSVVITPDMRLEQLGTVDLLVENIILIKADTSGEYVVLESGSVLCLEDRTVIGTVSETLGRVQQPLYSVRFTNRAEIAEAGISVGSKIFFVDQYSKRVLTQPLRAVKGSDASNIHDEEVGADEVEFSDDEAEAEHKRRVKLERQGRLGGQRGGQRGGRFDQLRASRPTLPQPMPPGGLDYDDVVPPQTEPQGEDDLYTPLTRPSNFHEVMGSREPPHEGRSTRNYPDRRGRGGSRSRGHERGRGRGRGSREWGSHRASARGGADPRRHNHQVEPQGTRYEEPHYGYDEHQAGPRQSPMSVQPYSPQAPQLPISQQAFPPPPSPYGQSAHGWPQSPQYPRYDFPPPPRNSISPLQPQVPHSPDAILPPGAYVNPAFFQSQQRPPLPQWSPPPNAYYPHVVELPRQSPVGSTRLSPESDAAFRAAQEKLEILRGLTGRSDGSR
ncbi:MAG: hypothetical protein M1817_001949 [Caeruleum heppii]|nr:MAG: hypothetical protein M1817_001949 [Caeruleum heppii]